MIRLWSAVFMAALVSPIAAASTPLGTSQDKPDAPEAFTFLFWTDQELDPGKEAKLIPHVEAMNAMGGKALPAPLGAKLEAPDFVASAGDSTGWPSHGAVQSWNKVCREMLKLPTRAVAGNHDSGGVQPNEQFYEWLRKDPFVKAHASDNGLASWKPPQADTGIIPGVNYSFRHKGVVFIMPSPTYDSSGKSPPGSSPIYKPDLEWLKKELAKYGPKEPKIVVNHFNAGSIMNREEIDALYKANGVLLITINRPEHGNAATDPMALELTETLLKAGETSRLVVLNAVGKDFCVGRAVNPLILHGQAHGGIAQGVGQALAEEVVFEPSTCQLLNGSFADYGIAHAADLPGFACELAEDPTAGNPLRVKGGGEGGIVPATAAVINALCDALDVDDIAMPATPQKVWRAINS